ncbi:MAG: glycosyltransferase family protein, partial [bacterium]
EQYDFEWIPFEKISKSKALKLYWIIDLHFRGFQPYSEIVEYFDIFLHSTKSLMQKFEQLTSKQKHIWFPNGVDDRYFTFEYTQKMYDIIFVGSNLPQRQEAISRLQNTINLEPFFVTGQDMIDIIRETKIHFNMSISCDVNYRNFETIGLGTCLLTNYLPEMEELGFINNVNVLFYKSIEDAENQFRKSIKYNTWCDMIPNILELAKENTYTKRIENLKNEIF